MDGPNPVRPSFLFLTECDCCLVQTKFPIWPGATSWSIEWHLAPFSPQGVPTIDLECPRSVGSAGASSALIHSRAFEIRTGVHAQFCRNSDEYRATDPGRKRFCVGP